MISEFLISIVWAIIQPFIDLLPDLEIAVELSSLAVFLDIVNAVCYMLPMGDIILMVEIVVSLTVLRIVIAFIKTIWELLPFV